MGEGFGAYDMGDDSRLLTIVASANVACGMHAGDPNVMHRVLSAARVNGVSVGAHAGFNDLWGFGRRAIEMTPWDLELLVTYQIGALQAVATHVGTSVTHLKAHGALYNMAAERHDYALAIGRAAAKVDPALVYVAPDGSAMQAAAAELGLPMACEAFVDRAYEDDGSLTPRSRPGAVVTDPAEAAERAVRMVRRQAVPTRSGGELPRRVDSLCVHGDSPGAVDVGEAVRTALEAAGIAVVTLPELMS
jgi:UPF0271 protein